MAEGRIVREGEVTFELEQRTTDVDPYRARMLPAGKSGRSRREQHSLTPQPGYLQSRSGLHSARSGTPRWRPTMTNSQSQGCYT
jgi:hypothetical protein